MDFLTGLGARSLLLAITALLVASGALVFILSSSPGQIPLGHGDAKVAYTPHSPIMIIGDSGFLGANSSTGISSGSGTQSDPYVIQGWDVVAPPSMACVYVRDAEVHFVVSGCDFGGGDSGVLLMNVSNATIVGNNCSSNSGRGIWLIEVSNCTLANNSCWANQVSGISLANSRWNALTNNTCSGCWSGISLSDSDNNTLLGDNCSNNQVFDLYLVGSDRNTILGCGFFQNQYICVDVDGSSNNSITACSMTHGPNGIIISTSSTEKSMDNLFSGNLIADNVGYAIFVVDGSTRNRFWNNTIMNNAGSGDTYDSAHVQASDTGLNWFNSSDGYGNYWLDWTAPDSDLDGIVDLAYNISLATNTTWYVADYYPRAQQTVIPEFHALIIPAASIAGILIAVSLLRRRR